MKEYFKNILKKRVDFSDFQFFANLRRESEQKKGAEKRTAAIDPINRNEPSLLVSILIGTAI